jgi:protein phosphatase PTC2/3
MLMLQSLSYDHKPYDEGERSRIEQAGGMVAMKRVDGELAVSRALGDFQFKNIRLAPEDCKVTPSPSVLFCHH